MTAWGQELGVVGETEDKVRYKEIAEGKKANPA